MITKNEAKRWTFDNEDEYWLLASIRTSIYEAIFNQKFYCDWASPVRYNVDDRDIEFINSYIDDLNRMGYKIKKCFEYANFSIEFFER
mgnify:CR=1 FL=1